MNVLQGRYGGARLERYLSEEREWAIRVREILLDRAAAEDGFSKYRILRVIPRVLHELAEPTH